MSNRTEIGSEKARAHNYERNNRRNATRHRRPPSKKKYQNPGKPISSIRDFKDLPSRENRLKRHMLVTSNIEEYDDEDETYEQR